jgi:xylulokinase
VTARPRAVLAIDAGTTELKTGVVGLDGALLGLARASYELDVDPAVGRAEQDPDDWWAALVRTTRALVPAARADIVAIGICGHGPTLAAVDADGRPTRPAITWLDTRPAAELAELEAVTPLRGWSLGVLPAALWVARHDAPAAARTRWWLNTWEAIGLRLTGRATTTLLPGQPFAATAPLAEAGIDTARVAPTMPAGEVLGALRASEAAALGLPAGTPVVAGMVDAFASCHGAGLVEPGDAFDAGGAAGGFGVYWDAPLALPGSFCTNAPLAGRWVIGGAMAATGKALDWFRAEVLGGTATIDQLFEEAAEVPPGADGLVFLPYLAGERSPLWDPAARGAFAGLTLRHGRGHLVRAILEAAALAIRHVAAPILEAGLAVTEMRVTGGPARSAVWNRIKADVTGFAVEVPHVLETAVVGSAISAAAGVGAHPDLPTAIRAMTRVEQRLEPDPDHAATYAALFEAYTSLHPAISPVMRRLALAGTEVAP